MFALVLAMVTLQNSAPDASSTPSSAIASKLPGASQAAGLQSSEGSQGFGNITVTAGCTYGAPRLGPSLLGDASDLTRTFSAPACTDASPLGFGPNAGAAFESGAYGLGGPLGYVPLYRFSAPTVVRSTFAPLAIEPGSRASETAATFTLPSRSSARILDHFALPSEFNGGAGPLTIATGSTLRSSQPHRPVPKPH
jgi:hypothetical protein